MFLTRLKQCLRADNIEDEKNSILVICCDEEAYKLLENLCIPNSPEEQSFEELISLLDEHFKPFDQLWMKMLVKDWEYLHNWDTKSSPDDPCIQEEEDTKEG
ncbi:hypothetical protein JTB14_026782 [Gonioctena quinquepunctata]|nr:hypothetical protein JTB14_026782 [Gonioctena quinquepunctata]